VYLVDVVGIRVKDDKFGVFVSLTCGVLSDIMIDKESFFSFATS
jgi:hypothetical protein